MQMANENMVDVIPFNSESVAMEAGRLMLQRLENLVNDKADFAFETTLSTKSYKNKILQAKEQDYAVTLLFFWLNNIELAKERVKIRVIEGGHNIPEDVIERRYLNGIYNLFDIYLPILDGAFIFDNSFGKHQLIAQKLSNENLTVIDKIKFKKLKEFYDNKR